MTVPPVERTDSEPTQPITEATSYKIVYHLMMTVPPVERTDSEPTQPITEATSYNNNERNNKGNNKDISNYIK